MFLLGALLLGLFSRVTAAVAWRPAARSEFHRRRRTIGTLSRTRYKAGGYPFRLGYRRISDDIAVLGFQEGLLGTCGPLNFRAVATSLPVSYDREGWRIALRGHEGRKERWCKREA